MDELLLQLEEKAMKEIQVSQSPEELEAIRVSYLGKRGELTGILKSLAALPVEARREIGAKANLLKERLMEQMTAAKKKLEEKKLYEEDDFDITLPGIPYKEGSYHPITLVQREIEEIFTGMGFLVADTPEVETDYYNFQALNIPPFHPARDMQDTYWLEDHLVLRTQTSAGQVRMMEKLKPPIRVIIPGRCFRNEKTDASHENTFFQLEGMVIDKGISVANLLYTMEVLLTKLLNKKITVRLRPGYFPFVEPGFELDIQCTICGGSGCPTCKNSGWVELLPCGMVHPNVLKYGHIDVGQYRGFAFGLGLTRLAMMKYNIPDIRVFNSGDLEILTQFR